MLGSCFVIASSQKFVVISKLFIYLGYSYGYVGRFGFSQGTGPILLGYLYCSGIEANLVKCSQNYQYTHTYHRCQNHYYDGAVKCECKL